MNSTENSNSKNCYSCCSCLIAITTAILLIIDFVKIGDYNSIQTQINQYTYSPYYFSCYQVCGYSYNYQKNGQCCYFYDYTYCMSKSGCISSIISQLNSKQATIGSSITTLSIISGALFIVFIICFCQTCKKRNQNQVPLLSNQDLWNINQSQKSNQPPARKIDTGYQSFAYVDQENSCCICLEQFNNEKAILLKCGHIFHSACIRDWAVKQQNCPVCRSSQ